MAGIGDRGVALDHPFSAVRHGDVPVAEVASYVPGGGSGAAAMALAVRSQHSAITAFSSAGYAAAMQALLTASRGSSTCFTALPQRPEVSISMPKGWFFMGRLLSVWDFEGVHRFCGRGTTFVWHIHRSFRRK